MQTIIDTAAADIQADPHNAAAQMRNGWMQYQFSMHVLGENTLESATRLGYLDAHELYPDMPQRASEDFAKEFYAMENPGAEYKYA